MFRKKETTLRYRCISESGVESRWSRLISQRVTEIEIEQMCPRGIHQQCTFPIKFYYTPDFYNRKNILFYWREEFFLCLGDKLKNLLFNYRATKRVCLTDRVGICHEDYSKYPVGCIHVYFVKVGSATSTQTKFCNLTHGCY